MRITRIDLEGTDGRHAIVQRRIGSIDITLLTPQTPNGRTVQCPADDQDELRMTARWIQRELDGQPGDCVTVERYRQELQRLAN